MLPHVLVLTFNGFCQPYCENPCTVLNGDIERECGACSDPAMACRPGAPGYGTLHWSSNDPHSSQWAWQGASPQTWLDVQDEEGGQTSWGAGSPGSPPQTWWSQSSGEHGFRQDGSGSRNDNIARAFERMEQCKRDQATYTRNIEAAADQMRTAEASRCPQHPNPHGQFLRL